MNGRKTIWLGTLVTATLAVVWAALGDIRTGPPTTGGGGLTGDFITRNAGTNVVGPYTNNATANWWNSAGTHWWTNSANGFAIDGDPQANHVLTVDGGVYIYANPFGTAITSDGAFYTSSSLNFGTVLQMDNAWVMNGSLGNFLIRDATDNPMTNFMFGDYTTNLMFGIWWNSNPPALYLRTISNTLPADFWISGTFHGDGSGLTNLSLTNVSASGLTLYGTTTNGNTGGSNWVGGISLWNPATGKTAVLTNGGITTSGNLTDTQNGVSTVISSNTITTGTINPTGGALAINGNVTLNASSSISTSGGAQGFNAATSNGKVAVTLGGSSSIYYYSIGPWDSTSSGLGFSTGLAGGVLLPSLTWDTNRNVTVWGRLTVTNLMAMPTNYVAANFTPIPGLVFIAPSNGILYAISQVSTNPLW